MLWRVAVQMCLFAITVPPTLRVCVLCCVVFLRVPCGHSLDGEWVLQFHGNYVPGISQVSSGIPFGMFPVNAYKDLCEGQCSVLSSAT